MNEQNYWADRPRGHLSRRRLLSLAGATGAGLGVTALAGCRGTQQNAGRAKSDAAQMAQGLPQPGGTFTWFHNKNDILDPQRAPGNDQQAVSGVYSRVFDFKTGLDPKVAVDHEIEPDLGLSAESPDAITWTVKLRSDARFHNVAPVSGHPVEAEDVKATFVRAIDPANPNRGTLDMIDPAQIQAPDKTTVVFKLKYPYAPFRKLLASPIYSLIQPREAQAGTYDPGKSVIGSGPFTLETVTPDVAWTYKRNPDWFQKGGPHVDAMRMAIIPDASQQLAQFTAGNLDEIGVNGGFTAFDIDAVQRSNPKAMLIKSNNAIPNPIFFQLGDPKSPFLDIRVRQAFSMAIDRDIISKTVWGGQSEQVVHVPSSMGKWSLKVADLSPNVQQAYKYNPSEAKKLLEAAGATNLQIKLTWANFVGPPGSSFVKNAEAIANFLNAAGVKTTLVVVDFNKEWIAGGKGLKAGFYAPDTILLDGQPKYTDADEFLFNFFDSKSSANIERLSDPILDGMIARQRTLVNEDERLKAVLDIQRYLAEKVYFVPTAGTYNWTFVQSRVHNYQYSSTAGRATETYAKLWLEHS